MTRQSALESISIIAGGAHTANLKESMLAICNVLRQTEVFRRRERKPIKKPRSQAEIIEKGDDKSSG